jgi:hypothetical protein
VERWQVVTDENLFMEVYWHEVSSISNADTHDASDCFTHSLTVASYIDVLIKLFKN